MPELPEVETTVRGLERVLEGRRLARVEPRRLDLRRAFPRRPRPAADRRHGDRPRPPRQIRADRHRPRRHLGVPPRHVGPLADRSRRARQARPSAARDRRRAAAGAQRRRAASARSTWSRPTRSANGRRFAALGPEPLGPDLDARWFKRRFEGRAAADQGCCCSTSGSSPGSATSMRARRCTAPASIRARAAGSISLARLRAARRRDPARCSTKRSRRAARALRDFVSPDGELGYFSKQLRRLRPRGRAVRVRRARSGASSRAAARPSTARAASAEPR